MPRLDQEYEIKTAKASISASTTDGAIVAFVTDKRIRIVGFLLSCGGTATSFTFNTKPTGSGVAISHAFTLGANSQVIAPVCKQYYSSNKGEGITATTGAGSTVGVTVLYIEE